MSKANKSKLITKDILTASIKGAFRKLNPRYMMKNPVMFVVEVGFIICVIPVSYTHLPVRLMLY